MTKAERIEELERTVAMLLSRVYNLEAQIAARPIPITQPPQPWSPPYRWGDSTATPPPPQGGTYVSAVA